MNENNFDYIFKILFFGDTSANKPKIIKCFADNFSEINNYQNYQNNNKLNNIIKKD